MSFGLSNFRPVFTKFLTSAWQKPQVNRVALVAVQNMNSQMVGHGVTMTEAHYTAATASLLRGDPICQFLRAENEFVLESEGSGIAYALGKKLHQGIHAVHKD